MAKFEMEVKILDINIDEIKYKLKKVGAIYKGKKEQKIYVYDVPTLYYRYLEICELLKSNNKLIIETNIKKLKILLEEFLDLLPEEKLRKLNYNLNIKNIMNILEYDNEKILKIIESDEFRNEISLYKINPNKWIRLRKNNDKIELTTKHIFNKENSKIQKVLENEINVSLFKETNDILESIGIVKRSYQEKIRYSYELYNASIEIDIWPMLNPYLEIECEDIEIIEKVIKELELEDQEIVSINTEQLYKKIGVNIQEISELKF